MSDCEIVYECIQAPAITPRFQQKFAIKEELDASVQFIGEVIRTPRNVEQKAIPKAERLLVAPTPPLPTEEKEDKRFQIIGIFVAIALLLCCSWEANELISGWRNGRGIGWITQQSYLILISIFLAVLAVVPSTSLLTPCTSRSEFRRAYLQTSLLVITLTLSLFSSFVLHCIHKFLHFAHFPLNRNIFIIYQRRFSVLHLFTDSLFSLLISLFPLSILLISHLLFHPIRSHLLSNFSSTFLKSFPFHLFIGLIPITLHFLSFDLIGSLPFNHFFQFFSIVYALPLLHFVISLGYSWYKIIARKALL